jgi:hypothetical protein
MPNNLDELLMAIFLASLASLGVALCSYSLACYRLKTKHNQDWIDLGRPRLMNTTPASWSKNFKFTYLGEFLKKRDPVLTSLLIARIIGDIAYGTLFILMAVLILTRK